MNSRENTFRFPEKLTFQSESDLMTYLKGNLHLDYKDLYKSQWFEWKLLTLPAKSNTDLNLEWELENVNPVSGCFFYYPWRKTLIRILEKDKFIEVVTNRNKLKITKEEQDFLATKRVGVVGLSVGRSVSTTIAMEKLCGELRVADFDTLDLSNLNRIKAPLFDLGELKTVSLARDISEFDPYFNLVTYDEGLTKENINDFFLKEGKLDLIIDECDHLGMKVLIRKKAKELGIPVIMDTSDRGMLDIERYDLDTNLAYFHGRLGVFDPPYDWEISQQEKVEIFGKILDISQISKRGQYSLSEIGKSISTWPQLASAVVAGGGNCTEVARRVLLGEKVPSGRFFMDSETIIANET